MVKEVSTVVTYVVSHTLEFGNFILDKSKVQVPFYDAITPVHR